MKNEVIIAIHNHCSVNDSDKTRVVPNFLLLSFLTPINWAVFEDNIATMRELPDY